MKTRDYAERRFSEHAAAFDKVLALWRTWLEHGTLEDDARATLMQLEQQDGIFGSVHPADWRRP